LDVEAKPRFDVPYNLRRKTEDGVILPPPEPQRERHYRYTDENTGYILAQVTVKFENATADKPAHAHLTMTASSEESPRGLWGELMRDVVQEYGMYPMKLYRDSEGAWSARDDIGNLVHKPKHAIPDEKLKEIYESFGFVETAKEPTDRAIVGIPMIRLPSHDMLTNPPIFDEPHRYDQIFEIGAQYAPYGHMITGGQSTSRGKISSRERLYIDWQRDKQLQAFYDELKQNVGDSLRAMAWLKAAYDLVLKYIPHLKDEWDDEPIIALTGGKLVTIGEVMKYGGSCRHMAILVLALIERAMNDGKIHDPIQMFYVRAPRHGWALFRVTILSGKVVNVIVDPAQRKLGHQEHPPIQEGFRYSAKHQRRKPYKPFNEEAMNAFDNKRPYNEPSIPDVPEYNLTMADTVVTNPPRANPRHNFVPEEEDETLGVFNEYLEVSDD
jgi:hypothetical protein